jgi:hypothetical protein
MFRVVNHTPWSRQYGTSELKKLLTHDGQQTMEVLSSLATLVDAVVYIEGQCIGPSLDVRVGLVF